MANDKVEMERKLTLIMSSMITAKGGDNEPSFTNLVSAAKKVEFSSMEASKQVSQQGNTPAVVNNTAALPAAAGPASTKSEKDKSGTKGILITNFKRLFLKYYCM